jgi:hypothetical protein
MRSGFLLLAVLIPATAAAQPSAGDAAYCNRLADVYDRYIGRDEFSPSRAFGRSSLDGDVASAQCRQGKAEQAIPVLERVLRGNGYSLPPRG